MKREIEKWNQALSLSDAAFDLNRSYLQTRDLLLRGELAGFKRDGRWYVKRSSLEAYTHRRVQASVENEEGDGSASA